MPLYEYECESCHHRFEKIRKFSDPPLEICPSCGGKVNKLVSSPAIQFKGTGWYITDYARKGGSGGGGSERGSSNGDGDKSSDSTKSSSDSTKSSDSTSSPQTSTSKDSPASGSGSSK